LNLDEAAGGSGELSGGNVEDGDRVATHRHDQVVVARHEPEDNVMIPICGEKRRDIYRKAMLLFFFIKYFKTHK
jgi:hypothetical protein